MPSTDRRRRSAIPAGSSAAVTQGAAATAMPTAALASSWRQGRSRQERPDLYTGPPTHR